MSIPLLAAGVPALTVAICWPDHALGAVGLIGGAAALAVGGRIVKAIGLAVAALGIVGLALGLQ